MFTYSDKEKCDIFKMLKIINPNIPNDITPFSISGTLELTTDKNFGLYGYFTLSSLSDEISIIEGKSFDNNKITIASLGYFQNNIPLLFSTFEYINASFGWQFIGYKISLNA